MVSDDGEQVPETTVNCFDPFRELGQPRREFREPLRFERGVDNDAAAFPECTAQRSDELASGVAAVGRQEFVVFRFRFGLSSVRGETTGKAVDRTDAFPRTLGSQDLRSQNP